MFLNLDSNRYRHYGDWELKAILKRMRKERRVNRVMEETEHIAIHALTKCPKLNEDQRRRAGFIITKYDCWSQ